MCDTLALMRRFVRADGPEKVTGSGRYTADLTLTGQLIAKFKYAGVSHGRITKLDVSAAREVAGVLAVLTQDDVPDLRYGDAVADRTLFARDVVRFEGEVIAAVAATSAQAAQAGVDAIIVEIDELPAVTDVEEALTDQSPLVHEGWADYESGWGCERNRNVASFSSISKGDAAAAMTAADHVVSSRFVADGTHALPIEPRSVIAQWEGNKVTIWTSTQVPFKARDGVCETLGLPSNRVRVIVPHLGGGFGGKCGFHFEAHIAALSRAARRPVKLVFSREEEFLAPDRRREGIVFEVTSGVMGNGDIVARVGKIVVDNGAYTADAGFFPQMASMHLAGPYKVANVHIDAHLVYTNHQPSGSVRAPTAPQACWALESHTDELAAAIGMDPVDFRLRNCVDTGDEGVVGQTYDEIGLLACIEAASDAAGYGSTELADDEAIGVAVGWWPSFPGASGAYVKLEADGSGEIITGAQECGTGSVMTLRQLAADELGMDPEDFQIIYQDTAAGPYDAGATGSQTLLNNGRAVQNASRQIAGQLREMAADRFEASPGDIVLRDGVATVVGTPDRSVPIAELARSSMNTELLLGHGSSAPIDTPVLRNSTCVGDMGLSAWIGPQFSCHVVRVKVDRDTGVVRVVSVHAAHDSGTIINPIAAQGQIEGGVVMGIGQALSEGTQYDERGAQRNAALLEYKLQTAADIPPIHTKFIEVFTNDAGPNGAKGVAEAPNVATAAAIANAISKVIGSPMRQLPMTAERVWDHSVGDSEVGS